MYYIPCEFYLNYAGGVVRLKRGGKRGVYVGEGRGRGERQRQKDRGVREKRGRERKGTERERERERLNTSGSLPTSIYST